MPFMDTSLTRWHEAIASYLIGHPKATVRQLADFFDVSTLTMAMVLDSELFRQRYREKKASVRRAIAEYKKQGTSRK